MKTTNRLVLKYTTSDDFDEIIKSLDDKYIQDNVVGLPDNLNVWISNGTKLTVRLKNNEFVGVMCINEFSTTADIGGWCVEKFRGNGYAHEAYNIISEILFAGGTHKLTANCIKGNTLAISLLESLNFAYNTTLKEHAVIGIDYVDILLYERFRSLKIHQ